MCKQSDSFICWSSVFYEDDDDLMRVGRWVYWQHQGILTGDNTIATMILRNLNMRSSGEIKHTSSTRFEVLFFHMMLVLSPSGILQGVPLKVLCILSLNLIKCDRVLIIIKPVSWSSFVQFRVIIIKGLYVGFLVPYPCTLYCMSQVNVTLKKRLASCGTYCTKVWLFLTV